MAGPLQGPPPVVSPITEPLLWAPELPFDRLPQGASDPEAHHHRHHHLGPGTALNNPPLGTVAQPSAHMTTPGDIRSHDEAAAAMIRGHTPAGALLDPLQPDCPNGATVVDGAGRPVVDRTGPDVDPYGICPSSHRPPVMRNMEKEPHKE